MASSLLTRRWLPCFEKNLALSFMYMHMSSSRWPQPSPIMRLVRRQEQGPTEMAQALSIMRSTSSYGAACVSFLMALPTGMTRMGPMPTGKLGTRIGVR